MLQARENYGPPFAFYRDSRVQNPIQWPTRGVKLGKLFARSGDKGGNLKIGFYIPSSFPASSKTDTQSKQRQKQKDLSLWLRQYLTNS
ncbi:hypothetical protein BDW66DRAFT_129831 [Aspergillus desertorum]